VTREPLRHRGTFDGDRIRRELANEIRYGEFGQNEALGEVALQYNGVGVD